MLRCGRELRWDSSGVVRVVVRRDTGDGAKKAAVLIAKVDLDMI